MHEQTTTKRVNVISLSLKGYFEIEIVVFHTLYTYTVHTHTHTCSHSYAVGSKSKPSVSVALCCSSHKHRKFFRFVASREVWVRLRYPMTSYDTLWCPQDTPKIAQNTFKHRLFLRFVSFVGSRGCCKLCKSIIHYDTPQIQPRYPQATLKILLLLP